MDYSIGPVRRGVNNLCEDIFNGGQKYIQPIPAQQAVPVQQAVQAAAQPVFQPPPPIPTPTVYKIPSVTYTPSELQTHFEALSSRYNDSFFGKR